MVHLCEQLWAFSFCKIQTGFLTVGPVVRLHGMDQWARTHCHKPVQQLGGEFCQLHWASRIYRCLATK
jgi:hypothetical protein